MKKFYLLICGLLLCTAAQAKEITFYNGTTPIGNGETVNFSDINITDEGTYVSVEMKPELYVSIDMFTASLNVTATCTSGQQIQMCCGGGCQKGTVVEKKNLRMQANQMLTLEYDFVGEFDTVNDIPTVVSTIEAIDGTNEATRKSFTIVMGSNASLTLIENARELKFDGTNIVYELNTTTAFTLSDMEGRTVMSHTLEGAGTLSTEGISEGIYIYRLGDKSGKIYIK